MIPRPNRLSTAQFNEVIKKGKVVHSPLFLMRLLVNGKGSTRIAAVVPIKIGKTAVARNVMKRKMYGAVQPLLPKIKEGLHIILLAKTIHVPTDHASMPIPVLKSNADRHCSEPGIKGSKAGLSLKRPDLNKPLTSALISKDIKELFVKAGILR